MSSVLIVSQKLSRPGERSCEPSVTTGWPSSQSRMVSNQPAEESMRLPVIVSPFCSLTPTMRPSSTCRRSTPVRSLSSPPRPRNFFTRCLRISRTPACGLPRPSRKILRKHDRELAPVHVMLAGRAVEHERTEEHFPPRADRSDKKRPLRVPIAGHAHHSNRRNQQSLRRTS